MDPAKLTFMLVMAGAVGAVGGIRWWFSEGARLARTLRRTPRVPIGQVGRGQTVRVVGDVVAEQIVEAPLSGRACVYFQVRVLERRGKHTETLIREAGGVAFVVEDGSGRALVDPSAAKVLLLDDHHTTSGTFDDATEREAGFLGRHGQEPTGVLFNRSLRYVEGIVEPGERVAIVGRGVVEPEPDGGRTRGDAYRGAPATRLRLAGTSQFPLLFSDRADLLD